MGAIELENVSFSYVLGEKQIIRAVKNISLNIEEGSFVAIVGHNGSGKSTLAKMLKEGNDNIVIVSSDAVRAELLGDENDQSRNGEVFNEVHKRIISSLKEGKDVIYDATNLSYKRRINFLKTISHLNVYKKCIVVLASYERCV